MSSATELLSAPRDARTVWFVDNSTIAELDRATEELRDGADAPTPTIAICDGPPRTAIGWLASHPWLAHVMSASTLHQHSTAEEHLGNVMSMLTTGRPKLRDWVGGTMVGRRIRLTHASRRVERLERMSEFLDAKGVTARTVRLVRDVAEDLLTNAFYDAPMAAGAVSEPIARTYDVSLPEASPCDLVYGCRGEVAIVRVRDPFGSLSRTRIADALTRHARRASDQPDGHERGFWRILTVASLVAISVVHNRHTEVFVEIGQRAGTERSFAFHLFFKHGAKRRFWKLQEDDSPTQSVALSVTSVG